MAAMQLFRSFVSTPIGDMLALASDEGLCALEFTTVRGGAYFFLPGITALKFLAAGPSAKS